MTHRLLVVLAAGLLALAGCTSGSDDAAAPSSADGVAGVQSALMACPEQGGTASADSSLPDVTLPCFTGGTLNLAKAPGVPMVVNLWASWCTPCRTELPIVQQLADTAGSKVRVVGIVSKDGKTQAASFADDAQVTIPGAFDSDGDVQGALALVGLPHTLFISADGSLSYVQFNPVTSLAEFEKLVDEHLGVQL